MKTQKLYCTFFLDDLFLGIDVLKVQEILLYQEMTRIPLADPVISGLINLRGQVVTAMDLRLRLGLTERSQEELPMNVIVQNHGDTVSLLVDEIGDVVEVEDSAFDPPQRPSKAPFASSSVASTSSMAGFCWLWTPNERWICQLTPSAAIDTLDGRRLLVIDAEQTLDVYQTLLICCEKTQDEACRYMPKNKECSHILQAVPFHK